MNLLLIFKISLFSSLIIIIAICVFHTGEAAQTDSDYKNTTLIAVYMVGSDLESEYNLGTNSIKEICSGLSQAKKGTDLVIAYGGSVKKGWSGMTISSLDDLNKDIRNNVIGDENYWEERYKDANMSDRSALESFLRYIGDLKPHSRSILLFWDHGEAYAGLCVNTENNDILTLKEVKTALKQGGIHWDLIAMDACFMGSYEVAQAVKDNTGLLLFSEQTIPGDGWDYKKSLERLAGDPEIDTEEFGKEFINDYMNKSTDLRSPKTLSLINLSKIGNVEEKAGELAFALSDRMEQEENYNAIGNSWYQSNRFGYDTEKDMELTVDFIDFIQHLENRLPEKKEPISQLKNAIEEAVIYERHDESQSGANGISVFTPRHKPYDLVMAVQDLLPVRTNWEYFLKNYSILVNNDKSRPVISHIDGEKYRISDDSGIQVASLSVAWLNDWNITHYYELYDIPVYPDSNGIYTLNPDDKIIYIEDTGTGNREIFSYTYLKNLSGTEYYSGIMDICRGNKTRHVTLTVMDDKSGVINFQMDEINRDNNGQIIYGKNPVVIKPGDQIIPYIKEISWNENTNIYQTDNSRFIPGDSINLTKEFRIMKDKLPYGAYYPILCAYDYNGNFVLTADTGRLRLPNNVTKIN